MAEGRWGKCTEMVRGGERHQVVAIGGDAWRKSGACDGPQGVRPPPVTGEKGREGGFRRWPSEQESTT